MAQKQAPDLMERIVSLCKRRGFVFQSSEIYGGFSSCYDYGPLGVELKRNVKDAWWRATVIGRDDVVGLAGRIGSAVRFVNIVSLQGKAPLDRSSRERRPVAR